MPWTLVRFPFRVWQAKRPALLFSPLFKHPRELLDIVISERDGLGRSLATHDEFEVKRATVKFLLLASAFPEWARSNRRVSTHDVASRRGN